jgi:endonuclease/exonuclease/phosphatase family metal-dependent hydrolase
MALPTASTVWGGDWNHAFEGKEAAGSLGGRQEIRAGLTTLGAELLTASQPHRLERLFTIDHIAVPSGRLLWHESRRVSMQSGGRHLSDHDAYVADVEPAG